ncbi:cytochrome c oxidase subunit 3 [Ekhidna lutea]|uniref:Cytochrome c oxidase subunit 3 n=1 Tax=Ekhidna lutea TaxID=447679 RepID=A0A239HBA6_EKHLU|nr:cytochrome c oxidase subunit 3 [Ekhidna lutea]SNS78716.1 cytochrome c oxidase subunit 3 [Ekhidna lutea]
MTGEMEVKNNQVRSMHPQKFAMWLFLVSVVMIFISLSSAYIVKKSVGNWVYIDFPSLFQYTTVVIVLSSISMHFAYISAKRNNIKNIRIGLGITAMLAIAFIVGQFNAWGQLVENGHHFVGNPAGSFVYIFTGLHVVHLAGAIIFLFIVLVKAFKYKVHSKSMVRMEMCTTFWHFLGGLWLYLYLFLIFNN